ncbi:MAG: hypothetical protein LUQ01_03535 [Methanolinea sp.]|nr:hypothetical protein [Methanolinea sp.]
MRRNERYISGSPIQIGDRTIFLLAKEERICGGFSTTVSVAPVALVIIEGTAVFWTPLKEGFSSGDLTEVVMTGSAQK